MSTPKYTRAECIESTRKNVQLLDAVGTDASFGRALVHHLTPRAPFANVRVKVGDVVWLCWDGVVATCDSMIGLRVEAICPFRGIRIGRCWFRSWIIVKVKEGRA